MPRVPNTTALARRIHRSTVSSKLRQTALFKGHTFAPACWATDARIALELSEEPRYVYARINIRYTGGRRVAGHPFISYFDQRPGRWGAAGRSSKLGLTGDAVNLYNDV